MPRRMLSTMLLLLALAGSVPPASADPGPCVSNGAITGEGQAGYQKWCLEDGLRMSHTQCGDEGCSQTTYCLNPLSQSYPFCS